MLTLKGITKDYVTSSETVRALKGVDISFRKSEFVSILGPSGCGKTTLLNIIGGLDHYTKGDLVINGRSTKSFRDRDWDVYRNHRIGFIFQSYNLIPHQNVLTNVELALTIAGIGKEERQRRAKHALDRVGLSDQYYKRPNQLSGGQCQRVAIARALVNDPEILLADEPTGALDTVTSVQIMELVKEISKERLVIMVTHNPELAESYSSRIVRLRDGEVIEDSNPFDGEEVPAAETNTVTSGNEGDIKPTPAPVQKKAPAKKREKAKMSFRTAFMLSLKNLFTKKGRSTLTAFAGSIGIIGIALILAVSQGMTTYVNYVQESTLSAYPLTLESTTIDISALMESFMSSGTADLGHDKDAVYKDPIIKELVDALSKIEENENDLAAFKSYLEDELKKDDSALKGAISAIQYTYDLDLPVYTKNAKGEIIKSDTGELLTKMLGEYMLGLAQKGGLSSSTTSSPMQSGGSSDSSLMASMMGIQMWEEALSGLEDADGNRAPINDLIKDQYNVIYGAWPEKANQVVLVLNERNELDDLTLYALGLLSEEDIDAIIDAAVNGKPLEKESRTKWTYEEICQLKFRTILPYNFYIESGDVFVDMSKNETMVKALYEDAYELEVVGIIRPDENADTTMLKGSIIYTHLLTEHVVEEAKQSAVVIAQKENPKIDVLTGLPFRPDSEDMTDAQKKVAFNEYLATLDDAAKADAYVKIQCLKAADDATVKNLADQQLQLFTDKDMLINMIVAGMEQGSSANAETIKSYFEDMELEDLKELMRSAVEDGIREKIHENTREALKAVPEATKITLLEAELNGATDEDYALYYDEVTNFSSSTYEDNLVKIGSVDLNSPYTINLYASTFENKDVIVNAIDEYNDSVSQEKVIEYTDFFGFLMSSITTIINAITYVLIAFVAISLIVSSIMIGVITLISVQERTKEIGILRAIGASKRDVSSMFNAETIIIGLASGILGVGVTYILCLPINLILHLLTGIAMLNAQLPIGAALILIGISVLLTLISGIIPARSAAKKDPVVALRTE